jgi:hypothetical protein
VQRKCACGGGCPRCQADAGIDTRLQTSLTIGAIGDRYEQEADRVSAQIMRMPEPAIQRQAAPEELVEEEELVQMKPVSADITPLVQTHSQSGSVEPAHGLTQEAASIIEERRGGSPLPESVRSYMEPRFAADFSGVRVHTGPQADQLNQSLHAHAFTYGRDIWLGTGESVSNLALMAHELTHVLQQSPSLMRSPRPPPRQRPIVQRKNIYFSLPGDFRGKGSGTKTGDYVYGEIAKENENAGLLFEVNIPGAKKGVIATFQPGESGVVGRADFYKASTTIGVTFEGNDPDPVYLPSHRSLRVAGTPGGKPGLDKFEHENKAAPIGKKPPAGLKIPVAVAATCPTFPSPAVCRLKSPPTDIGLGDLKPSDEAERLDGVHQLNDYIAGIKLTADKVATFAAQNPTRIDPAGKTWKPSPGKLGKGAIKIPDKFKHPSTAGKQIGVIRYRDGKPDWLVTPKPIPAYLYVVPDPEPGHEGIWIYEYEPVTKPVDVKDLKQKQDSALGKLNDPVIKELNTKPAIKQKRKPGPAPPLCIQRKKVDDKFNFKIWSKDTFKAWQDKEAKPYLGSPEKRRTEFVDTLVEIKKRSLPNLVLPAGAQEVSAGLRKIQHWSDHGNTFGRLRGIFGGVYVKVVDLYEKARDRFRKLLPSTPKSGGGGLPGTLLRVGVKILKFAAHFIIGQVAERLTEAFKTAAENVIQNLFGKEIAEFEEHIASVRQYITNFEDLIKKEVLAAVEDLVKPYKDYIETIKQVVQTLSEISTWVNRIKWLVRGVSCLAPPALGCLWGFFGTTIAEAALSEMAESCWFRRDVMYPVLRAIDFIKKLPGRIADFILQFLIDLLPGKAKELIGDVSKKEVELNDADACKDLEDEEPVPLPKYLPANKDPTPEQLEYVRLLQKWEGREGNPIAVLGELLHESGISPNLAMSMERLKRIDKFLENIKGDAQAIRNYIKSLKKGVVKKPTFEQVLDYAERSILQAQPTVILEAPPPKRPTPSDERRRREGVIIFEW